MDKLLHSKVFRRNLFKWLFMYVAVLGLATSVITYSRYITSLENADSARQPNFSVDIKEFIPEGASYECESTTTCLSADYRPTKPIEFYFSVDATKMEVLSNLIIRVSLDPQLIIDETKEVDEKGKNPKDIVNNPDIVINNKQDNIEYITFTIKPEDNLTTKTNLKHYKVVAHLKENANKEYVVKDLKQNVYIGYSAEQVTK